MVQSSWCEAASAGLLHGFQKYYQIQYLGAGRPVGTERIACQKTVLTKEQYKRYRSHIKKHTDPFGIPQGSPISALLANVYMMDVDRKIKDITDQCAGLYMRYSDDFMVVLPLNEAAARTAIFSINQIIESTPGLTLEPQKTQIYKTDLPYIKNIGETFLENADGSKRVINFLGFTFDGTTTTLRAKTVSKYYYRMYRKAHTIAENPDQKGKDHLYRQRKFLYIRSESRAYFWRY